MRPPSTRSAGTPFWRDERFFKVVGQAVFAVVALGAIWFLMSNMTAALRRQNLALGFDFFPQRAGFDISDHLIPYTADSNYLQAFLVGLLNTLLVSVLGVIFASALGLVLGVAQLSSNLIINKLSRGYTELMRNVPLLVFLIFWYQGVFFNLPRISEAAQIGPMLVTNRGVAIPWFVDGALSVPVVQGRAFQGGLVVSPEFSALLSGLALYTAAFIGEVIRAGIQAISKGQMEAARALGLNGGQSLRLIILPQALRVIIPPMTSQFLNLTKNSSLAAAIGYPDLWATSSIVINQTGRAVEVITLVMAVYLTISLVTSGFMNWYNRRVRLIER